MALGVAEAKGTLVSPLTAIAAAAGTVAFTLRHHEESRIRVRHEQIWGLVRVTMADAANSISRIPLTHQSSPATVGGAVDTLNALVFLSFSGTILRYLQQDFSGGPKILSLSYL